MPTWTVTSTDQRTGREGTRSFDDEVHFSSFAREVLTSLWASNVSAVMPGGDTLDESQLRSRFGLSATGCER